MVSSEAKQPVRFPTRDAALDATRTMAIWLMIICHVARLIPPKFRPDFYETALRIEPLCQALFMVMVGVSLVYSMRIAAAKGAPSWGHRQRRRALELYGIGFLFFFVQYGWQWPWLFIGHGILLAISTAILFLVPWVRRDFGLHASLVLSGTLIGLFYATDYLGVKIPFLTTGHGSFLPHVVPASFGVVAGYLLLDGRPRMRWAVGGVLVIAAVLSFLHLPWLELFSRPFGRVQFRADFVGKGNGFQQVWSLITEDDPVVGKHPFYHMRCYLVPLLLSLCSAIYLLFRAIGPVTRKLNPLWSVGRQSLDVYVLHLVLVAGVTVVGGAVSPFRSGLSLTACGVLITLICYGYAAWKERRRKR